MTIRLDHSAARFRIVLLLGHGISPFNYSYSVSRSAERRSTQQIQFVHSNQFASRFYLPPSLVTDRRRALACQFMHSRCAYRRPFADVSSAPRLHAQTENEPPALQLSHLASRSRGSFRRNAP